MNDIRNWSKQRLTDYIVQNKHNSWMLKEDTDDEVREWATGHDTDFLVQIVAGWNREELRSEGLYLD